MIQRQKYDFEIFQMKTSHRFLFYSANAEKCNSVRVSQREATVDQLRGWSEVKKSADSQEDLIVSDHAVLARS
jgi:hypothetical protein